jgi:hypothetical protein
MASFARVVPRSRDKGWPFHEDKRCCSYQKLVGASMILMMDYFKIEAIAKW